MPLDQIYMASHFPCSFPLVTFVINFRTFLPFLFARQKKTYREITFERPFDTFHQANFLRKQNEMKQLNFDFQVVSKELKSVHNEFNVFHSMAKFEWHIAISRGNG